MPTTKSINLAGNNITRTGFDHLSKAVKKLAAKSISIKIATTNTLKEMKEFLIKAYNYNIKDHNVYADKAVADELLGSKTACEQVRYDVKKAFYTGAAITSLEYGHEAYVIMGGIRAGASALIGQDSYNCLIDVSEKFYNSIFGGEDIDI